MADEVNIEVKKGPGQMAYQGLGIRFVSLLIDTVILSILFAILGAIFGINNMENEMVPWYWGLIYFIIYIGYYTYLEGTRGQTVGKMITRIKVVREDGGRIDMGQAFTRNILRIIDGFFAYIIGAILIWRSDKQQRLGDSIAKTVVVKA